MSGSERVGGEPRWFRQTLVEALSARLTGPGGYYNVGNALGLAMSIFLQMRLALAEGDAGIFASLEAAGNQLAGSWSAVALTVATLIFFWSGEVYHRAWTGGSPDPVGIRRGDFLSGIGCVALATSLLLMGDPILAATSGLLLAGGKFGTAFRIGAGGATLFRVQVPQLLRTSVLVSRLPAIGVTLIEIARVLGGAEPDLFHALAMPVTLLVCNLLWSRADILLFEK